MISSRGPSHLICRPVSPLMHQPVDRGTATDLLSRTMFTIDATNTGGTTTTYLNLTVVDELSTISYSPDDVTLVNNTASSDLPLSPTVLGDGEILSWAFNACQ